MQGLEKILEEIGELRGQAGSECTSEDHYIKILSRKEQDEVLKRIAACQIICNKYIGIKTRDEIESGTKMTENLADIAVTVGGESGADKVMNTVHKYNELNS